jgi:hypothetical protein
MNHVTRKTRLRLLAPLVAVAMTLSACGGSDDTSAADTSAEPTQDVTESPLESPSQTPSQTPTEDSVEEPVAAGYGEPDGTATAQIETEDGYTADATFSWWDPVSVDPAVDTGEVCVNNGGVPPTFDPDFAWRRFHVEATYADTTTGGFEWPEGGYGGSFDTREDSLDYCVTAGDSNRRVLGDYNLGSVAMDGSITGLSFYVRSPKTPANPEGETDPSTWMNAQLILSQVTSCEAAGVLFAEHDGPGDACFIYRED